MVFWDAVSIFEVKIYFTHKQRAQNQCNYLQVHIVNLCQIEAELCNFLIFNVRNFPWPKLKNGSGETMCPTILLLIS